MRNNSTEYNPVYVHFIDFKKSLIFKVKFLLFSNHACFFLVVLSLTYAHDVRCVVAGSYEPPLTNVFTMQWFLTMFATCLPHHTVLKIWDSVFFEGSEVLLRVALAIWAKLAE